MIMVEYYNPSEEKKGCVFRAISKALNKSYDEVKNELKELSNNMGIYDLLDDRIFNNYLLKYGYKELNEFNDKNLLENDYNGVNIVYSNYNDWYHMVCIIDNVIYDKFDLDRLKNLKVIKAYKK